ncbi:MAG TPA: DsrE family protein [Burkholderiales bacterium]|nr:DsrE family protein [Burkholderiales bacterium]
MKTLFVLNDGPYGSERSYNALRLAGALAKAPENEVRVFLLGDAAGCAKAGHKVPEGYYNIQLMLGRVARHRGTVAACGTCMDARGIAETELSEGVHRGTLDELAQWTQWADKVLVF